MKASGHNTDISSPADQYELSNEDFLAIWTPLVEGELAQTTAFDKVITTLSAGALAVSITFIHEMAPTPRADYLLAIGWLGFGTALVVNLVSYLVGQFAYRRQAEILQDLTDKKPNALHQSNKFLTAAFWLNGISAIAFIIGVIGLGLFAWANLHI
jgi:hypothetical protein